MFFLLRMAFWIGLVLVLLPADKTPESDKLPQVDAADAISAASAAVSDLGQFCARQPQACAIGGQAASVIGHRAQSGARKVYHFLHDDEKTKAPAPDRREGNDKNSDRTGSIGAMSPALPHGPIDTLTPDDLMPDWRGTLSADDILIEPQG